MNDTKAPYITDKRRGLSENESILFTANYFVRLIYRFYILDYKPIAKKAILPDLRTSKFIEMGLITFSFSVG